VREAIKLAGAPLENAERLQLVRSAESWRSLCGKAFWLAIGANVGVVVLGLLFAAHVDPEHFGVVVSIVEHLWRIPP
jgi:hypothetical protein